MPIRLKSVASRTAAVGRGAEPFAHHRGSPRRSGCSARASRSPRRCCGRRRRRPSRGPATRRAREVAAPAPCRASGWRRRRPCAGPRAARPGGARRACGSSSRSIARAKRAVCAWARVRSPPPAAARAARRRRPNRARSGRSALFEEGRNAVDQVGPVEPGPVPGVFDVHDLPVWQLCGVSVPEARRDVRVVRAPNYQRRHREM